MLFTTMKLLDNDAIDIHPLCICLASIGIPFKLLVVIPCVVLWFSLIKVVYRVILLSWPLLEYRKILIRKKKTLNGRRLLLFHIIYCKLKNGRHFPIWLPTF